MRLNLYDTDLNRISVIGNQFISCAWSEGYNTVQPFVVELQATPEYMQKVKPDCYVGRADRKTLMVIKTVQIKDGHIVASGKQAARCLDDVACESIIRPGDTLDASIKAAYEKSDRFHNLFFEDPHLNVIYPNQISNKTCMKLMEIMCQETDTGFRVVRDGQRLRTEFYRPSVNPAKVLSERYGNLKLEAVVTSTENLKNCAIVLGAGEGEDRFRVRVDMSGGAQKRSVFVDARDLTRQAGEGDDAYSARLYARGCEKLLEQRGTWECILSPLAEEFGKSFDLGDVVTVLLPEYKMKLQTRIARFTQKSQDNVISTTVEVGTITITR